ncbi:MAG TPA: agmatinase [Firmicutes bacterium]|nr:agmatinase [Bacillota bacterium]
MGRKRADGILHLVERSGRFFASGESYESAGVVIVGGPMDFTASWRPGARFGPARIRAVSDALEDFSPEAGKVLEPGCFFDLGDVMIPPGNVAAGLSRVETVIDAVVSDGKLPILLGGEHLVTLASVRAMHRLYPELTVVQLDAHMDLRHDYLGEALSHATVMRRVIEVVGEGNLYQCGIRSGTREEFEYALERSTLIREDDLAMAVKRALDLTGERPLYVTLDIDVVDPAFAPGTGTPEPGGYTSRDVLRAVRLLVGTRLVGFDLVEVAPPYDHSDMTSLLAAKIVREVVLARGCAIAPIVIE